jgi:hypothetical protein
MRAVPEQVVGRKRSAAGLLESSPAEHDRMPASPLTAQKMQFQKKEIML